LKLNTLVESVDPVEGSVDKRRQLYPAFYLTPNTPVQVKINNDDTLLHN
jgi:hypothetical protein